MKNIFTVVKKEILDISRDRRTLLTMIIIPLLLFPVMMSIFGTVTSKQIQKEVEKATNVAIMGRSHSEKLTTLLSHRPDINLLGQTDLALADTLIKKGIADAVIVIAPGFDSLVAAGLTGNVQIKHKDSNWAAKDKIKDILKAYNQEVMGQRMAQMGIPEETLKPVNYQFEDLSTSREKFGKNAGGMVPYIFLIFSYLGCLYPAIEMFTNEKERGTLETLLTAPVNRLHILFGKMAVVSLTGLISAILSIIGLSYGLSLFANTMPGDISGTLSLYTDPKVILLLLLMLVPLVVFIAGLMTVLTNYARSYKEAQSLISPLMMVIIIPAVIGMLPFMELNAASALVPITNLALASKEIIAGTLNTGHYLIVVASLFVYAFFSVLLATVWFGKEKNILRV
jgi:sodium transport system permease protein